MLKDYPYMMTPDNVAAFTGATGQEIRKLLNRGEMQGCRIGVRWLVPKLGLLKRASSTTCGASGQLSAIWSSSG